MTLQKEFQKKFQKEHQEKSAMLFLVSISLFSAFSQSINADNFSITYRFENLSAAHENLTENLFEIRNDDYYRTKSVFNLTFNYSIYSYDDPEGILEKEESFKINNFKYRKSTGLGKFAFENGTKYMICTSLDIVIREKNSQELQDIQRIIACNNFSIGEKQHPLRKRNCSMNPEIIVDDYSARMDSKKISFKVIPRIYSTNNSNSTEDYLIEYWIEDIYGNILKKKMNTSSNSKKTFTIKDNLMMTINIRARIYNLSCINTNDVAEKSVAIIVNPEKVEKNQIEILDITQMDSVIFVKIALFRNTTDNKIDLWLENHDKKISNVYSINILTMYADTIISIPIIISEDKISDISERTDSGTSLIVEGFGKRIVNIIDVKTNHKVKDNIQQEDVIYEENKEYSRNITKTAMNITLKTIKKDFFWQFIQSNKTENVINSPTVNDIG